MSNHSESSENRVRIRCAGTSVGLAFVALSMTCVTATYAAPDSTEARIEEDAAIVQVGMDFRDINVLLAPIQSKSQLDEYHAVRSTSWSPFDYLSAAAKQRFIDGLKFNPKGGLAGLYYDDLESELTPVQTYEILSLFGKQHLTPMVMGIRPNSETNGKTNPGVVRNGNQLKFSSGNLLGDHIGYQCVGVGSCKKDTSFICTSNC